MNSFFLSDSTSFFLINGSGGRFIISTGIAPPATPWSGGARLYKDRWKGGREEPKNDDDEVMEIIQRALSHLDP